MYEDTPASHPDGSGSLYDWWLGTLPALFAAVAEPGTTGRQTSDDAAEAAATGRASQALKLTQQWLDALYAAYFGALIKRPANEPLGAFEDLLRGRLARLAEQLDGMVKGLAGPAELRNALAGLAGGVTTSIADLAKPLSTNLERAYGGLADAFGLAPVRELEATWRELAYATHAQRLAQAQYLEVLLDAARQGVDASIARLAEMGERGEKVETMLALVRVCTSAMDAAMHKAMQSPHALQASSELIRATLRARRQQQRIVAMASAALNVPTRAEVDEAYREIQQLKREVRRLRKATPAARAAS
jgi:hypothetical protein